MALVGSLPTPNTSEPSRVVISETVGAPVVPLTLPVAPIAPEPLDPVGSTPAKLITVMDEVTLVEKVAVTVTLLSSAGAKARQISAVPFCVLVLCASTQTRPAPLTELTVTGVVAVPPDTSASRSSFANLVERAGETIVVAAAEFWDTVASTVTPVGDAETRDSP